MHRVPYTAMGRAAYGLLLVMLAWALLAAVVGLASIPFTLRAEAPEPALTLLANRTAAGRGDAILFVIWLNLTGSGQSPGATVNLTFEGPGDAVEPALVANLTLATYPGACLVQANLTWLCFGLTAGADYLWTIPAAVRDDAWVGGTQNVTASAVTQVGTGFVDRNATAAVQILGAAIDLHITSDPRLAADAGELITYAVTATNRGIDDLLLPTNTPEENASLTENATAHDVVLRVGLLPGLGLGPGSSGLIVRQANLTPGSSMATTVLALVDRNAAPGSLVGLSVTLWYTDHGYNATVAADSAPVEVHQPGIISPASLILAGAIGLAVILAGLGIAFYFGQRRLVIDEAFLLHKGGTLIEHASRTESGKRDDDLVASMFVAIQDFVKDSFRTQALLDEVSFGGRRAAVVRGKYVILAAVVSRGDVDYLFPQMVAAVAAIESTSGRLLETWGGGAATLVGAKGILNRFVRGGYRAAWKAQLT